MIYRTDYHVHSLFSDGKSAPEDYIAPANAAGLKEIGFSEHLTLFRGSLDWSMKAQAVEPYLTHIKKLSKNTRNIKVKTGLEVDFFPGKEEEINSFLSGIDLDYVIGSVHYLGDATVDLGPEFYEGKNINRLYELYFEQVVSATASGLFDIIAHCDLIRIYGFMPSIDQEPLYRKLAKSFKIHDVAFEVNTNGRNRPIGDFYPDRKFLKIFCEENVPVCVNSDAHMPSRVAQYFEEAYELLKSVGYSEMAVFDKKERFMIPFKL
jgi:histidinol-phosphatase (PHP family)